MLREQFSLRNEIKNNKSSRWIEHWMDSSSYNWVNETWKSLAPAVLCFISGKIFFHKSYFSQIHLDLIKYKSKLMQNNKQVPFGYAFCRFCISFYQAKPSECFLQIIVLAKQNCSIDFSLSDWTTSSLMWGPTWLTWTWSPLRTLAWCSLCPPTRSRTIWASPCPGTA